MPLVATKYFGAMPYEDDSVFEFPLGLPGFENENRFVFIELDRYKPLVFLQNLERTSLCFLALPILVVDPGYTLTISPEDLEALALPLDRQPALGSEILAVALISMHDSYSPTANLMAPVVVNLGTRQALQAIRRDARYSHQHPLAAQCPPEGCVESC